VLEKDYDVGEVLIVPDEVELIAETMKSQIDERASILS